MAKVSECYRVFAAVFLLCVLFAACGRKTAPPRTQDGIQAHAAYAVIFFTDDGEAAETMQAGIEAEAAQQGSAVDIFYADAYDGGKQQEWLTFCAERGYTAVGIALSGMADADCFARISDAAQQGVPIVLFGVFPLEEAAESSVSAVVTVDAERLGVLGANYIVSECTAGGEVAILADSESDMLQRQGAEAVFRTATGLHLLESDPTKEGFQSVKERAEWLVNTHPNLKAIYCCNSAVAVEAVKAVKKAGKSEEIRIVGTGGAETALKNADKAVRIATVSIDYREIGAAVCRKLQETENGQKPPAAPETVYVEPYIAQ